MLDRLIRRYDRPVPRYTSYPTAPHFHPGIDAPTEAAWLAALPSGERVSLYLHVPFCAKLCRYCGCHTSVASRRAPIERYRDQLAEEIALVARLIGRRQPVAQIHWGGGTPNMLQSADLLALHRTLGDCFAIDGATEVAVELDPRALSFEQIATLARIGVRRASLGVQDFDPAVQAAVDRVQPYELVARVVRDLKAVGISAINLDLMYGLPLQTPESVAATADLAADLGPRRLALFGYAHVPWMKRQQQLLEAWPLPDGIARHAQATAAAERLQARGYVPVGLDHFARPEDPLVRGRRHRNFQGYTTDPASSLIGFGPSAISRYAAGYAQNAVAQQDWAAAIADGRRATARGIALDDEDRVRAAAIERLMCDLTVDLAAVAEAHGRPADHFAPELARAAALAEDGLVELDGSRLGVTPTGRPWLRVAAALFDTRLAPAAQRHARAV